MTRNWYLIDDSGYHQIDVSETNWDFWSDFRGDGDEDVEWPAFTQIAIDAPLDVVFSELLDIAAAHDRNPTDVSDDPVAWDRSICLTRLAGMTLASEPSLELDERFLGSDIAENLFDRLGATGAYFGYDPAAGTLHLSTYEHGRPTLSWADSLQPGPSHAVIFDADGSATHEDPRSYALRRLDQPETSPLLDRYQFAETILGDIGLDEFRPLLTELPVEAALELED